MIRTESFIPEDHNESWMETIDPGQICIISSDHSSDPPVVPIAVDSPSSPVVVSEPERVQIDIKSVISSSLACVTENSLMVVEVPNGHSSYIDDVYIPSALQYYDKQDVKKTVESNQPNSNAPINDCLSTNEDESQKEKKLMIHKNTRELSLLVETTAAFFQESVTVNHITIAYGTCNKRSLSTVDLSNFPSLISFTVQDCSFKHTEKCHIVNCPKLKSVVIQEKCFTVYRQSGDVMTGKQNTELIVDNCPKLKELSIGRYSFYEYTKCTFRTLPSLKKLKFGKYDVASCNFASCPMLELIQLPCLKVVVFGSYSFCHCTYLTIHSNPHLCELSVSENTFSGDSDKPPIRVIDTNSITEFLIPKNWTYLKYSPEECDSEFSGSNERMQRCVNCSVQFAV